MAKLSAKDKIALRKQQEQQKKEQFRAKDEQRRIELEKERELEENEKKRKAEEEEIARIEEENPKMKKKKKSQAKAAGLKSTFVISDDQILMTTFGKGNEACPEKYVKNKVISDITGTPTLAVENVDNGFLISGRVVSNARTDNPFDSVKKTGMDRILCKDQLEKIYFGKTFEDNIHIQLIYKILDIEKILTVHMNNIVFEINNLRRCESEEYDDLIGYMGDRAKYENFKNKKDGELYAMFKELLDNKRLAYFGSQFIPLDSKGKRLVGKDLEEFEKRCYYLFCVLGIVRQATAHGDEITRAKLFNMDELKKFEEASVELNKLYSDKIKKLNEEFAQHSGKDLEILFSILSANTQEEKAKITREFYDFTILKSYKNMGFSIKKVRENLANCEPKLKDKEFDTVRRKMNKCIDFIIWKYYEKDTEKLSYLVESLRASSKEAEKELIYKKEAEILWADIKDSVLYKVLPQMNGTYIKDLDNAKADLKLIGDSLISDDADSFSKMIYLLTIFLDGKEINDLLTQLISNFDNIASFITVMRGENMYCSFEPSYKIFENCEKISKELRVINSFARMTSKDDKAAKFMYLEAAQLLGYRDESAVSLDDYVDNIVNKDKMKEVNGKKDASFRNFIANNVIESTRFKYLVRYGNPVKLKKLAQNRAVVDFVLKDIPDDQIKAYYNSCNGVNKPFFAEMRDDLAEKIINMDFTDFENVRQKAKSGAENIEKERKKSIVRIYLTVLYLLVKNLVYVNSRYFLAFHCVERDALLYDSDKYEELIKQNRGDKRQFAMDFVTENLKNERARRYINMNYNNSDAWATTAYRNCVEHLNAVRNADLFINDVREFKSYFELYHYLVQRSVMKQYDYESSTESSRIPGTMILDSEQVNPKVLCYFNLVNKYKTYCKDFVKALNVPFAYNLARYKNLSIDELFDRNNYLPKKAEDMEPENLSDE